jgi:hypothetical protein
MHRVLLLFVVAGSCTFLYVGARAGAPIVYQVKVIQLSPPPPPFAIDRGAVRNGTQIEYYLDTPQLRLCDKYLDALDNFELTRTLLSAALPWSASVACGPYGYISRQ